MQTLIRTADPQSLSAEVVALLKERGTRRFFAAGSEMLRQGDPSRSLHVILKGRVRVERRHSGLTMPLVLAEIGPGSVAGEMGVLDGQPRSATVTALEETETVELDAAELLKAAVDLPEVTTSLMRVLGQRLRKTDDIAEVAHRQLLKQYELILNTVGEAINCIDLSGCAMFVNDAMTRLTGYEAHELVGQSLHDLLHHSRPDGTPYPIEECPIHSHLRDPSPRKGTGEIYWRKDGSHFTVDYTRMPVREGGRVVGAAISLRDATERAEVERVKDELVSIVSHELRTPLTSIRGSLGLLAGGQVGPVPAKAQRMLDIAVNNTDRLVRLINDILDIERLDSGKVTLERAECNTADLLAQARDLMQPMADKAGVLLAILPQEGQVWADPDRILQTLTNLVGNAIKFSPSGGTVSIAAHPHEDHVLFEVNDEGRGIPADKLDTIFERFRQVDASDAREKGGSGLGLAICRSIVQQHGGRIWAESHPGQGSRFLFTVPSFVENNESASATEADSPAVLVIDDDHATLGVIRTLLQQQGYRAIVVTTAAEALEEALSQPLAAIVLDVLAPKVDSMKIMAQLKDHPELQDVPVISFNVLSASDLVVEADGAEPERAVDVAGLANRVQLLHRALATDARPAKILIVEDDLDLAHLLGVMLEQHGFKIFHAKTGREAIQMSQRVLPNLIVLDLILPDGDGFSVVDWLRQHESLRRLPLAVYTARELDEEDQQRLRLGDTLFLSKGTLGPEQFDAQIVQLIDRVTLHQPYADLSA